MTYKKQSFENLSANEYQSIPLCADGTGLVQCFLEVVCHGEFLYLVKAEIGKKIPHAFVKTKFAIFH